MGDEVGNSYNKNPSNLDCIHKSYIYQIKFPTKWTKGTHVGIKRLVQNLKGTRSRKAPESQIADGGIL
jgi:hypothetical protein